MTEQTPNFDLDEDDEPLEELPEPVEYPFVIDDDQRLRCFIFESMANADIDGRILVDNCQKAFDWIKTGTVPAQPKPGRSVKPA